MSDQEKLIQQLKDALVAIKKLKADLATERYKQHEPIAIIGMSMRLPGNANDEESYWQLLSGNKDAITAIPSSRFDVNEYYDSNPDIAGKIKVKQGGFLNDIDKFDGNFYDITPVELENVDPQQRFLLELTHEALENAGMNVRLLEKSRTGVFCGVTNVDYQKKHFRSGDYGLINHYAYTGSAVCAHAGRLSYLLGLQGPSLSIDTACSSSLVAVHLAVQSLRRNESNLAIVGACNLILEPELTMYFSHLNGLSEDGRCRPFADNANGFVRSEGAAIIVLQRLSDAVAQKRNILGVIKGSAVNQDGRSNGFTAPDVGAQSRLMRDALQDAGITPKDIDYIEAHGTGTKIGDPIEFEAIANVYGKEKDAISPLWIGSVKSNIGHTESVAGLAGIIKVLLAFKKKALPATLHFDKPNSLIDWANTPIKVVQETLSWDKENRTAGVSGFGVTGTNAHLIIAEPPTIVDTDSNMASLRNDILIMPVYAKRLGALQGNVKAMAEYINHTKYLPEEICANAVYHRTPFNYRNTFVAKNITSLKENMESTVLNEENEIIFEENAEIKTVFVFPGQGTQWKGMALQLAEDEPIFKQSLDESDTSLQGIVSWNLWKELREGELERIDIVQPILVAVQIALAKLWQHYGIMPDAVIGHSMGEISAAYIAGKISLDHAYTVICHRSRLMHTLSGKGEMLATDLTVKEAEERIQGYAHEVSLAVVNSRNSTVISGNPDVIQIIATELETSGRFAKKIKVDVASHSPQMEALLPQLKSLLTELKPLQGNIAFLSTAIPHHKGDLDADYWTKNLRNTVHFGTTIQNILEQGEAVFIEMSPHPTLIHAIQENIHESENKAIALPSLFREKNEHISFFTNFAKLHDSGYNVDWKKIYPEVNNFVQLPNYAWQKQRYWFDTKPKFNLDNTSSHYFYTTDYKEVEENKENNSVGIVTLSGQILGDIREGLIIISHEDIKSTALDTLAIVADLDGDAADIVMAFQNILKNILSNKNIKKTLLITKNAVVYGDKDMQCSSSSVLFGAARSIAHEHPELNLCRIDTDDFSTWHIPVTDNYKDIIVRKGSPYRQYLKSISPKAGSPTFSDDIVMITGGTSGLGLETAVWLGNNGAKKIALVSRNGQKAETSAVVDVLLQQGINVKVYASDIADKHSTATLLNAIRQDLGEVTVLIHAAGILEDMPFTATDRLTTNKVLAPKLAVAQLVDTVGASLRQVVLFSSAASVLGTIAQSVYAGANFYLDQYAAHLRNKGITAIAVAWGNIGEIGLAAADTRRGKQLAENGIHAFSKIQFHQLLGQIMSIQRSQILAIDIDFRLWSNTYPALSHNAYFEEYVPQQIQQAKGEDIFSMANLATAERAIRKTLKDHISSITKITPAAVKEDITFKSLGIDSMMAVQLKNKIQDSYKTTIAVANIWAYPTVEKFTKFLVEQLSLEEKYMPKKEKTGDIAASSSDVGIDEMSLEDLMRELEEKSR